MNRELVEPRERGVEVGFVEDFAAADVVSVDRDEIGDPPLGVEAFRRRLFAVRLVSIAALVLGSLAYTGWLSSWIDFIPEWLQAVACLAAAFLFFSAFAYAVLTTITAEGIVSFPGIA
ncbi:MAG: hypothetical protein CK431_12530 [Mycobacterium sp.]|nr:MAG: hypothetical protein CK431_12530 [Mycobacterium sp.]